MKLPAIFLGITFIIPITLLSGCQMGDSSQMSKSQHRQMQSTFQSMQESHRMLLEQFEKDSASMPDEMKTLYLQMQDMHHQMAKNHKHMMSGHKKKGMGMQDNEQMQKRRQMRRRIQNKMSREWYAQMQSMHNQMGRRHEQMNQPERAKQHRKMGQKYGKMKDMVPRDGQSSDEPINENADPALLNGANLYAQNCASCHGQNAQGIGDSFPPLLNAKWVTGDPSVPVRIIRDGLQGSIDVNGQTYQGTMPAFKARLSIAEIAAILNYLRENSDGNYAKITQDDVIEIVDTYGNRNAPWKPEELTER